MKTILAIDDKSDNLISIHAILKNYMPECKIVTAESGASGIEIAKREHPDTILLDIIMPGMDGYEVCRKLKQDDLTKHIPVIMLTAIRTDTESKIKGLESGADAFLTKPIEPNELTAQIRVMLRIKDVEDELRAEREHLDEIVRQRTEELHESRERLQLFMDSATDIFTLWSKDLTLLEINRGYSVPFYSAETDKEKLIGMKMYELYPQMNNSSLKDIFQEAMQSGQPHTIEDSGTDSEDRRLYYMHKIFKAGEGFGIITSDVTDQKNVEMALRESEEKLRNIFENSTNMFYSHNLDNELIYVSPQIEEILGYTQEEAKTKWYSFNSDNPINEISFTRTKAAVETGQAQPPYEIELVHKSGKRVWVEVREAPIVEDGKVISVVGSLTDVTERKQAEIALKHAQEQLHQSQKMEAYGQLAGGIAHDFNNILGAILGYSELIEGSLSKEDSYYSKIQNIKSAAKRAADLTKQLLAFSRKQTLQPQIIDLNLIVKDLKKMLKRMIEANIELETEFEAELNPVLADPGQIGQIIMNLVVNARDAMSDGGTLKIQTSNESIDEYKAESIPEIKPGEYVVLKICDSGCGIGEDILDVIFEPFFTTKDIDKGTGLGLSVVHGIVKQSNGFITVDSKINIGTCFTIYLPAVNDQKEKNLITNIHRVDTKLTGTETILIVEDSNELRYLATEILRAHKYNVLSAVNSNEALDIVNSSNGNIDLILTDIIMPGMNGLDLADSVKNSHPNVKIVYMSGYADGFLKKMNIKRKITPLLEKPFTMNTILRIIREALDS